MEPARLEEALRFATEAHAGQLRKDERVPYIFHPLAVAGLVAEYGGDEGQIVAALLHDVVEDAGGATAREEIRRRFGDDVTAIVDGCTDTDVTPKPPWRPRKERFLAGLRRADPRVRLVVAADKLHNARSLAADLRERGEAVWERFNGGRDGTLWYQREVVAALRDGWGHAIVDELERAVGLVEQVAKDG